MWDLVGENVYAVTIDIAVCLEESRECVVEVNVVDRVKFPKTDCVWSTKFTHTSMLSSILNFSV